MGTYVHINGIVYCEAELDQNIRKSLTELTIQDEFWHRNNNEDYLFSLSIKEV